MHLLVKFIHRFLGGKGTVFSGYHLTCTWALQLLDLFPLIAYILLISCTFIRILQEEFQTIANCVPTFETKKAKIGQIRIVLWPRVDAPEGIT